MFSASFWITFLFPGIATSINIHIPFSLSRIAMSGLLLRMVLSVCTCWFHSMVTSSTCFYWFWYMFLPVFFLSNCTSVPLHMLRCNCALILCLFIYCSFASIGPADMMWSVVSSNWWQSLHLLSVFVSIFCCVVLRL
jgi:hypothetical protein